MNKPFITFTGNLTADPVLNYSKTGKPYVWFTVACNYRVKDNTGQWGDGEPLFFGCTAFGTLAENVTESLVKGDAVTVTGELSKVRSFERPNGAHGTSLDVIVNEIGASLNRATVQIHKNAPKSDWNTTPVPQARNTPQNDPAGNLASLTGAPADPWTVPADDNPPF